MIKILRTQEIKLTKHFARRREAFITIAVKKCDSACSSIRRQITRRVFGVHKLPYSRPARFRIAVYSRPGLKRIWIFGGRRGGEDGAKLKRREFVKDPRENDRVAKRISGCPAVERNFNPSVPKSTAFAVSFGNFAQAYLSHPPLTSAFQWCIEIFICLKTPSHSHRILF